MSDKPKTTAAIPAEPKEPKRDNRIPLSVVKFRHAVSIPGAQFMSTSAEPGVVKCPQPYLDLDQRVIVIGNRCFPVELVHYWERAKMAKSV